MRRDSMQTQRQQNKTLQADLVCLGGGEAKKDTKPDRQKKAR